MRKITCASPGPRENQDYVCKDLMPSCCLRSGSHLSPGMHNSCGFFSIVNIVSLTFCGWGSARASLWLYLHNLAQYLTPGIFTAEQVQTWTLDPDYLGTTSHTYLLAMSPSQSTSVFSAWTLKWGTNNNTHVMGLGNYREFGTFGRVSSTERLLHKQDCYYY